MRVAVRALLKEFLIEDENTEVRSTVFTAPNVITCIGIAGIVFYVFQFTAEYYLKLIPITVFLIGLSDLLDGFLARRLNQHTYVGKFLDPFRDKMLMLAVLGNLLYLNYNNALLLIPLIAATVCEVIIIVQNTWYLRNRVSSRVHFTGKLRMLAVLVCIGIMLVEIYWFKTEYVPVVVLVWIIALLSVGRFIMKSRVLIRSRESQ